MTRHHTDCATGVCRFGPAPKVVAAWCVGVAVGRLVLPVVERAAVGSLQLVHALWRCSYTQINPIWVNLEVGAHWLSLGYWRGVDPTSPGAYRQACHGLARLVGDAAELVPDDRVLDVGFGCGEQLVVWRGEYGVASIHGVNASEVEVGVARHRLEAAGFSQHTVLSHGLAEHVDALPVVVAAAPFTKVVCVDSAYHFNTRRRFLEHAFRLLAPGGSLVCADICVRNSPTGWLGSLAFALGCRLAGVPKANAITAAEYRAQLERVGFAHVSLTFVEDDVFPAFTQFVHAHNQRVGSTTAPSVLRQFVGTAALTDVVHTHALLHFVVVRARKPSDAE